MSCKAEFKINNVDGTSSIVTLEAPVDNMSYKEIVMALLEDKDKLQELADAVNNSKFPSNEILEDVISDDIQLGSSSLGELVSIFNSSQRTPEMSYLVGTLQDLGVNVNETNILLTTATFRFLYNNKFGYYSKNGKELYVTRNSSKNLEPFLKYRVFKAYIENNNPIISSELYDEIGVIMDKIEEYKGTKDKKKAARISKLKDQINGTLDFIKIYYMDSLFKNSIDEIDPSLDSKLNKLLFPEGFSSLTEQILDSFPWDRGDYKSAEIVASLIKEVDGKILLSNESMDTIKQYDPSVSSIEQVLQELNNVSETQLYFELEEETKDGYILKTSEIKPEEAPTLVDSEFYGELVNNITTMNGYNIIESEGKYFVTNRVVNTKSQLPSNSFDSEENAKEFVKKSLIRSRLFNEGSIQNIAKKTTKDVFTSKASYNVGDRFSILDIKIDPTVNIFNNPILSSGKSVTFTTFFKEFKAKFPSVIELFKANNIIIENALNTPEKVETFLYLMSSSDSENIEGVALESLLRIKDASTIVYEITDVSKTTTGNNYKFEKIFKKNDIPQSKPDTTNIQSKMNLVTEHLSKNYGITVNALTAGDIDSKFKTIMPNANRVRAFIYNGEIYLNTNNANNADRFHEFAHLAMGYIKRNNPDLYYTLVDKVETLKDFGQRVEKYKRFGDTRALPDLKEEIFVTVFGDYAHSKLNDWFIGNGKELNTLSDEFKKGVQKAFQVNKSIISYEVQELLDMSMFDIFNRFGSMLFSSESLDLASTIETRQISNIISDLIKNNVLTEKCE